MLCSLTCFTEQHFISENDLQVPLKETVYVNYLPKDLGIHAITVTHKYAMLCDCIQIANHGNLLHCIQQIICFGEAALTSIYDTKHAEMNKS